MDPAKLFAQSFLEDYRLLFSWLGKNFQPAEVEDILGNFRLYPQALPTTEVALEVYQAGLRIELLRANLKTANSYQIPKNIILASRNLSEALLIFLDGAQPQGVFDVNLNDLKLATCFCFEGKLTPASLNTKLAEVEIDFGIQNLPKIQLMSDQIVRIPQSLGTTAQINLKVFADFKIAGYKKFSQKVAGSKLGLVFDCRGRPILAPGDAGDREKRARIWRQALEDTPGFLK